MKKDEYIKFIDPNTFRDLYILWSNEGKPQGNNQLYIKIWNSVENAVKACIGALQNKYHCKYQDYDEKVVDGTILIMNKLINMTEIPKNIVSMCYLPVLGICCSKKALQQEWENNMESFDIQTEGGDTFKDLLYLDDCGNVKYGY